MSHTPPRISSLSKEYVQVFVRGATGDETVQMAFIRGAEPTESDWIPAEWANITPQGADAQALIGPGGAKVLTEGTYQVWVRITTALEVPVLHAGPIIIT
ncbi:MAG: hypothetical protein IRZ07_04200 [Microbispora sp.]|nr:hypothetical protein [Microbispora sp.]